MRSFRSSGGPPFGDDAPHPGGQLSSGDRVALKDGRHLAAERRLLALAERLGGEDHDGDRTGGLLGSKSFDGKGNYTLGIREQIIFPEINYDKIEKIKGMNITIVTTAKNDEEGRALLRHMGMPFRTA